MVGPLSKSARTETDGTAGTLVRRIAVAIGIFGGLAMAWPFFGAIVIFALCDTANCPSPGVLLAWAFALPIVGVASVLAGILAPWKPAASAKTFFVAAALYFMVAVLGPVSMGEGLAETHGSTFGSSLYFRYLFQDLGDLITHGLLAPLVVIPLAMGVSLLRWGKIRHEIIFSKALAKTLFKGTVVYFMVAVLSLLWFEVIVIEEHANASPLLLAPMSAIALVIGVSLFIPWSRKTWTP